jgi:hypothetical protein
MGYVTFSEVLGQQCLDLRRDKSFRPMPEESGSLMIGVPYDTAPIYHKDRIGQ